MELGRSGRTLMMMLLLRPPAAQELRVYANSPLATALTMGALALARATHGAERSAE